MKMKQSKAQLSVLNASQRLRTLPLFTFSMTADLAVFAVYANRTSNGREIDANEMRLCSIFPVSVSCALLIFCFCAAEIDGASKLLFFPSRVVSSLF